MAAFLFAACGSKPTDMRSLVPADSLVYLETNDLGNALNTLTESKAFAEAAKSKPDFSALAGMQTAVAITGFEASENQVTEENSVLSFKPRFVAVADAHTWNTYALKFTEEKLGAFVNETYGGEVELETAPKNSGKSYIWTAKDGRKVFAYVSGSRIFFSNDETALEKTLAVARGEAESLIKNEALARARENAAGTLALGYVSPDGIAQIANFAGVSTALDATDDTEGRGFIAKVLPQVLRGSVREGFWTATKTEQGIEDKYNLVLAPETATVFKETMVVGGAPQTASAELLPGDVVSATRYNLKSPQIAWRSLLLVAGRSTDPASAGVISSFAGAVLEPYGIDDAEKFLSGVDSEIWTANFDADGDDSVAIAVVKDAAAVKASLADIDFKKPAEKVGAADVWKSADGDAAAFVGDRVVIGEAVSVAKCVAQNGANFTKSTSWPKFVESNAVSITFGRDSTEKVVSLLGEKKNENLQMLSAFVAETRFSSTAIERRTVSPFGFIGRILEQFED